MGFELPTTEEIIQQLIDQAYEGNEAALYADMLESLNAPKLSHDGQRIHEVDSQPFSETNS